MRGKWGIAGLAAVIFAVSLIWAPATGMAADTWERGGMPFTQIAGQTAMEAQMQSEKPFQTRANSSNSALDLLSGAVPGMQLGQDGSAVIRLPRNLEMKISVLYNREPSPLELNPRRYDSLLMKSSLDYRLLPNLEVGLNAYLYRPEPVDNLSVRPFGDPVMGLGPGIKYDLGRWSFLLKSQLEAGNREHGADGLQSSVRIWYAF